MSDFAQSVKQQADIVKVIEGYIRLRKAGATNYSGLCPFHKEKSPSFSVHAVRQFFHCFGCGVSGDVFTFVSKMENVSFPEAVRIVAQKCGIPLPKKEYSSPEEAAEARMRRKLLDLHEAAAAWFEEQLAGPEGAVAREYLAGRGLDAKGIKEFRIGYAPDGFNGLRDFLGKQADAETLRASGLFSQKEHEDGTMGAMYDRFRKRVMFPIANEGGRVIAFTARTLETGEKAGPKYINSPETPLYSKGQVLFNLDKAKGAIRTAGFALLVEGQMDCISVYLRGIHNVIATSGTALTAHQISLWRRNLVVSGFERTRVVANFDPDGAGGKAAEKTIDTLIEENFEIKIVILEGGLDPDRFIRERGIEAYTKAVRGAKKIEDFLINRALQTFPGTGPEQKRQQMNYLFPFLKRMPEMLSRDLFQQDIAQKLGIDSAILREELRNAALTRRDRAGVSDVSIPTTNELVSSFLGPDKDKSRRLASFMSAALVEGTRNTQQYRGALTGVERVLLRALAVVDPEYEQARRMAVEALTEQPALFESLPCCAALGELAQRQAADPMEAVQDESQRARLAEALLGETKPPGVDEVFSALQEIQERAIGVRLREVRAVIAEAERRGDHAEVAVLSQQKMELDRALRKLHNQRPPEE